VDPFAMLEGSGIDLSISSIIAGLIFGVVAVYVFRLGVKRLNYPLIFISIALGIFPIFTHGPWQTWGLGFLLCGIGWYVRD
jgi:multisubunit Na+/H+ antiporter MnhE subunit